MEKNFTLKEKKFCPVEYYRENRPSILQLINDFKELKSFVQVGNKYGISDNAIRKGRKLYEILIHKKELLEFINKL